MEKQQVLPEAPLEEMRGPSPDPDHEVWQQPPRPDPEVWQLIPPVLVGSQNLPRILLNTEPCTSSQPVSRWPWAQAPETDSSDYYGTWFNDYSCCGLPNWYCHGAHPCHCPEVLVTVEQLGDQYAHVRVGHDSARSTGRRPIMSGVVQEALGRWSPDVEHCCEVECCCKGLQRCCKLYRERSWMRWSDDIDRFELLDNFCGEGLGNWMSYPLNHQINLLTSQSEATNSQDSDVILPNFTIPPYNQELFPTMPHEFSLRQSTSPLYKIAFPPSSQEWTPIGTNQENPKLYLLSELFRFFSSPNGPPFMNFVRVLGYFLHFFLILGQFFLYVGHFFYSALSLFSSQSDKASSSWSLFSSNCSPLGSYRSLSSRSPSLLNQGLSSSNSSWPQLGHSYRDAVLCRIKSPPSSSCAPLSSIDPPFNHHSPPPPIYHERDLSQSLFSHTFPPHEQHEPLWQDNNQPWSPNGQPAAQSEAPTSSEE